MPYPSEKVTMMEDNRGGSPYKNLQSVDLRRSDSSQSPFQSTTSRVEYTISGRKVYRPLPKK